jgi:hypothetical protein
MRTIFQFIIALPVTRQSMGREGRREKESPLDVGWMIAKSPPLSFQPVPGDAIPYGDLLLSPSCLIVEARVAFGIDSAHADAILVCAPLGDAAELAALDEKLAEEVGKKRLPSLAVNDSGIWSQLARNGFDDLRSGEADDWSSSPNGLIWFHLRTRFPASRLY